MQEKCRSFIDAPLPSDKNELTELLSARIFFGEIMSIKAAYG
jgi:hypothetical protein